MTEPYEMSDSAPDEEMNVIDSWITTMLFNAQRATAPRIMRHQLVFVGEPIVLPAECFPDSLARMIANPYDDLDTGVCLVQLNALSVPRTADASD